MSLLHVQLEANCFIVENFANWTINQEFILQLELQFSEIAGTFNLTK